MARKSKFMHDGSDSSDSGPEDEDTYDPNDPDVAADRELFHSAYRHKRKRANEHDDSVDEGEGFGRRKPAQGKRVDYLKGQSFVASGSSSSSASREPFVLDNLSTVFSLEPNADAELEGDEDDEMEMDLDSSAEEEDDTAYHDEQAGEETWDQAEEEEERVPIPAPAPESVLGFAPRGIGAKGKGGIGAGRAGIQGTRAGFGGAGTGSSALPSTPKFASATAASHVPLGGSSTVFNSPSAFTPAEIDTGRLSGSASPMTGAATPRTGLGAGAGIGSSVGMGIGARSGIGGGKPKESLLDSLRNQLASASVSATPTTPDPVVRRSFLPTAKVAPSPAAAPLSAAEAQHFARLSTSNSLGLRMLEKMGYKNGTGLGSEGQGIVTPVGEGTRLRKKGEGINFGGRGERTEGSKAEGRRRGEVFDEPEQTKRGPKEPKAKPAWQQPARKKEKKGKTEYKSYEDIVAEAGETVDTGVGMLVDISGNALSSQSLSSLPTHSFGAASADTTRLPELRHNLTLLSTSTSSSLSSLAREGVALASRRTYLVAEEARIGKVISTQASKIARLEGVMRIVERVREKEREVLELLDAAQEGLGVGEALGGLIGEFDDLLGNYASEYKEFRLDEVVVSSISVILRRLFSSWNPLQLPSYAVPQLKRLRRHFLIDQDLASASDEQMEVDIYSGGGYTGSASNGGAGSRKGERMMTPYESFMWTVWLPRVRSALNNDWSPLDSTPAVTLFNSYSSLLPAFLKENVLDQLILPKLSKAISDWAPSCLRKGGHGIGLHEIVFPWLELIEGAGRAEKILEEARGKVRAWLGGWKVRDGIPKGLDSWKAAFSAQTWDALLLASVLPKLGVHLRDEFAINPREQELQPLENVLAWRMLLRASLLDQLLETEFFAKWLEALWVWLTNEPDFDQVAQWYTYWKSYFPSEVISLPGVSRGFKKGLELMNQASALGDDARYRLRRPDTSVSTAPSKRSSKPKTTKPRIASSTTGEVSFREIVESFASDANLLFLPTGRSNEKGSPLYRIAKTVDGKSGVTIYLTGDVVYVLDKEGVGRPVALEDMVQRAGGGV